MAGRYCYWSVATGRYAAQMEACARSARACGVFTDFHVLTDRQLEGCECYDAYEVEKETGLFRFYYLKAGMTKLNYEYFVWLDADTVFRRNPLNLLECLGASPIHVPLERNLAEWSAEGPEKDSLFAIREALRREGVANDPWWNRAAFWIVHREAIDAVYELALGFHHKNREAGVNLQAATALGYATQILCGDPERHRQDRRPDLWASAEMEAARANGDNGAAILHVGRGGLGSVEGTRP